MKDKCKATILVMTFGLLLTGLVAVQAEPGVKLSAAPDAAAIYTAKCAKCHGADGKGVAKYKQQGQKDFTDADWQKSRTDAQLTEAINNGKGDFMPGWKGKLAADEIKALVGHVRVLGKKK